MREQSSLHSDEPNTKTEEPALAAPDESTRREQPKKRRGFAAMDRAAVREIARKGGVAAHERGTAHRFTTEEARTAGQKGGRAPHRTRGRTIVRPSNGGTGANGASASG